MKSIVLAAGGTGGHIYPAAALAEHIEKRLSGEARVWMFGAAGGAEEKAALKQGVRFRAVKVVRLPDRKVSARGARLPLNLMASVASARRGLQEVGAGAVVGFGGYVSFPTVAAAKLMGLPVFLHEANTAMGKSNRMMAGFAAGVFTSFEDTEGVGRGRAIYTGNPCRFEGAAPPDKSVARKQLGLDPDRKTLMIFGGSQGAASINKAAVEFAGAGRGDVQLLHISGPKNYEALKKEYEKAAGVGMKISLLAYCDTMDAAYAASDLVVCRAGATTITELMCLGVPAVLVPYPFAAEGHQDKNAVYISERGAAVVIRDKELAAGAFGRTVEELLNDNGKLKEMSEKARKLYRPGAAEKMARTLMESARTDKAQKPRIVA